MNRIDVEMARHLEDHIYQVCDAQKRYRVLWIVGEPRCGKTPLCRYICDNQNWRYVNFTLDRGFLDSFIGREETYRPDDFLDDLYKWCAETQEDIIVIDEIEPLLSLWNWDQQEAFFKQVGRAADLPVGVALVTRSRNAQQIRKLLSGMHSDHVYEIEREISL